MSEYRVERDSISEVRDPRTGLRCGSGGESLDGNESQSFDRL